MMMELMMKLPDDIFRHELLSYLALYDLGRLFNMCMNHEYRPQVLDKIRGVILMGYRLYSEDLYVLLMLRRTEVLKNY